MNINKISVIAIAMLAGAVVGYGGCHLFFGLDLWIADAVGLGTAAGVAFSLSRS